MNLHEESEFIPNLFEQSVVAFVAKDHGPAFEFRKHVHAENVILAFGRYLSQKHRTTDAPPFDVIHSRIINLHKFTPEVIRSFSPQDIVNSLASDWDEFIATLPEQVQVLTINIVKEWQPKA